MARPLKNPPVNAAAFIEEAAALGADIRGVAQRVGVGKDTLRRWFAERPELHEAYERGRERERASLHNVLYSEATEKGNIVAAMFLLKARHGYREGDQGEQQGNRVNITFTLPGALTMDQFRTIDGTATHDESVPAPRIARPRGR